MSDRKMQDWISDDITFCSKGWKECGRKNCERHPKQIHHPELPHSYSDFSGSDYCPIEREKKMHDELKLKPCPFCGSVAEIEYREVLGTWMVQCSNQSCPASYMIGSDYDTEKEAIEFWNHREGE